MKTRLNNLSDRERYMVFGGVAFILLLLVYVFIWSPLSTTVDVLNQRVSQQRETLQWVRHASSEIFFLRSEGVMPVNISAEPLLVLAEKTLAANKLSQFVSQVQQTQQKKLKLIFNRVPFDALMTWLQTDMKSHGVSITSLRITRTASAGMVSATLALEIP